MERLPLEMIVHILNNLDLDELASCRLVCKSFLSASYCVKIEELVLNKSFSGSMRPLWFYTNSPKYCEDPISLKKFLAYRRIFNFENRLKRLHLNCNDTKKEYPGNFYVASFKGSLQDCHWLQCFSSSILQSVCRGLRQLKQLEICAELYSNLEAECEIDLPSLEIFVIDRNLDFIIDLNAPKLRILKIGSMNKVRIREPKSVKRIHTNRATSGLKRFENLERLTIEILKRKEIVRQIYLISDALIGLNFLEGLHLVIPFVKNLKALKNILMYIHHQKTVWREQEFKVFYQGVELVHFDKMDEYSHHHYTYDEKTYFPNRTNENILKFQIENYDLLQEDMSDFESVSYNELMEFSDNWVPPIYLQKCSTIHDVQLRGEPDLELLLGFLNKLKFLDGLWWGETKMDPAIFLGRLNAPRLRYLTMSGAMKADFNGEVLLKFPALFFLSTTTSFELKTAFSLFERLKRMTRFGFSYKELTVAIEKRLFFNKFEVQLVTSEMVNFYKTCSDFDQIREFCSLVENRECAWYWTKSCALIYLRSGLSILGLHHLVDRLFNRNLTWHTDMLIKFINPDIDLEGWHIYVGPSSELLLDDQ